MIRRIVQEGGTVALAAAAAAGKKLPKDERTPTVGGERLGCYAAKACRHRRSVGAAPASAGDADGLRAWRATRLEGCCDAVSHVFIGGYGTIY